MADPLISVVGVYAVPADDALFQHAMELKFRGAAMSARNLAEAERAVRSELASVVLIECQVSGADSRFRIEDFVQPDSDQAPYDEAFLSNGGTSLLARRYARPSTADFRFCFFLHSYDPNKPLRTSYGMALLPQVSTMPDRLRSVIHYDPVD